MVAFMHVMAVAGLWLFGCSFGESFPAWQVALALLGTLALSWSYVRWYRARASLVLHISGAGQMRLAKQDLAETTAIDGQEKCELVRLLPTSTIWPCLLVLHLQKMQGETEVVLILRDTVTPEVFHGLLVACRWIAARRAETDMPGMRQI